MNNKIAKNITLCLFLLFGILCLCIASANAQPKPKMLSENIQGSNCQLFEWSNVTIIPTLNKKKVKNFIFATIPGHIIECKQKVTFGTEEKFVQILIFHPKSGKGIIKTVNTNYQKIKIEINE